MIRRLLLRRGRGAVPPPSPSGSSLPNAGGQEARAGSLYIALSLGTAGVMTYVFLWLTARSLSLAEFGVVGTLWSATLLFAPLLWTGITQTLGRYVSEREARGEDWGPVVRSTRRLTLLLLVGFSMVTLFLSPLLTERFFGGEYVLTAAFVVAIGFHSLGYLRRGLLSGHRQFSRVGASYVAESVSRVCVSAALLVAGFGLVGPAVGIALAPLFGVLFVRAGKTEPPQRVGAPFDLGGASRFMLPVLVCMACAQALANGGALLIIGLGGPDAYAQAGLLVAALTLARAPQSVLGPAVTNLLPHLSRMVVLGEHGRMRLFVLEAAGLVGLLGLALIGGMWLLGGFVVPLIYGPEFSMSRELLVVLATLAAFLLLCELLNQVLFAQGFAWLAAGSWSLGLAVAVSSTFVLRIELLERVSYGVALGAVTTALAQVFLLAKLRRPASEGKPTED